VRVHYVVYQPRPDDEDSGKIIRSGHCSDAVVELQHCGEPGVKVLIADEHAESIDPNRFAVVSGVIVPKASTPTAHDQTVDDLKSRIRQELSSSDKTQISDFPVSSELREKWRIYRQALRDLTGTAEEMLAKWPKKPGAI
jgi:hypothetical protein